MQKIEWTSRFQRNYERYNGQRARVRSRILELQKKMEENPTSWLRTMERLQDPVSNIYRFKITDGDRLIFSAKDGLLLIDVGPHTVIEEYQALDNQIKHEILNAKSEVPSYLLSGPSNLGSSTLIKKAVDSHNTFDNSEMRWLYEEELSEAWLQFLDTRQLLVKESILNKVKVPGSFEFHLILGGAGTGKTVVLLNLALSLSAAGRNVICQFSDQVTKYLNSGKQRVPGAGLSMQPGTVVLLDDPLDFDTLKKKLVEARKSETRALVVALDPFQWVERRVYEKFHDLMDLVGPTQHNLDVCYRQSKNVGEQAIAYTKSILDKTSPFIIDSKIAEHKKQFDPLKKICIDDITFVDEGGRYKVYQENLDENFELEFERFLARDDKWKHWHPVLLIYDPIVSVPIAWDKKIKGNNVLLKSMDQVNKIRGPEFQEVFLLLSGKTWKKLQEGVPGAGVVDWEKLLAFHTILTRSKDSTIIFVKMEF